MNILKYNTHQNAVLLPMCALKQAPLVKGQRPYSEGALVRIVDHAMVANCSDPRFCTALQDYTAAPLRITAISHSLHGLEFEKKICRAGFKKSFGQNLSSPGLLEMNFGLLDVIPTLDSSRWKKRRKRVQKESGDNLISHTSEVRPMATHLCFKTQDTGALYPRSPNDKSFVHSGIQLMSSDWVLERLEHQIKNKRSVRAVLNELIRDVEVLLNNLLNSPVLGVRITASGRYGKKKKGMAQQQSVSIGKVPLGTFSRKVDYSQGFVVTKLGLVGLKVWVAFR